MPFEVADLNRGEVVVKNDEVGITVPYQAIEFVCLALANVGCTVNALHTLCQSIRDQGTGCFSQ